MHTYILTDHSLTVLIGTKPYTIPSTHPNFEEIKSLLPTDTPIEHLIDIPKSIEQFFDGRISISPQTNTLTFDDQPIDNTLTHKIIEFVKSQSPNLAEPLVNFLVRSRQNPSYRTTNNLYEWVSKSGLPITPDGFILAWKAVNGDLYDYHAQKNQHLPGAIISQPRNECDEDPDQTCSAGLHFCAASYLPQYLHRSDVRVVVVKIDPADVVAIPRDYGISKGRCCKYEVVAECPKEDVATFFPDSLVHTLQGLSPDEKLDPAKGPYEIGAEYVTRGGKTLIAEMQDIDGDTLFNDGLYRDDTGRAFALDRDQDISATL